MALSLAEPVANVEASKSPDWASWAGAVAEAGGWPGAAIEEEAGVEVWADGAGAGVDACAWGVEDWVEVAAGAGVDFLTGGFWKSVSIWTRKETWIKIDLLKSWKWLDHLPWFWCFLLSCHLVIPYLL